MKYRTIKFRYIFFILIFCMFKMDVIYAFRIPQGESSEIIDNTPCLTELKLVPGSKALIVMVPGDANLARIFYGFAGCSPDDFLEFWLNKAGFSALSISYPTDNSVFNSKVYPYFTIEMWATQAFVAAENVIHDNHMNKNIILVVWSMGGATVPRFSQLARLYHYQLTVISLSATPPLPDLIPNQVKSVKFLKNGLSDRVSLRKNRFLQFLSEENAISKHVIIPKKIYIEKFLGNPPVSLLDTRFVAQKNKIIQSSSIQIESSHGLAFRDYSITGILTGESESDFQHVFADSSTWMFLNNQMIYRNYVLKKNLFLMQKIDGGNTLNKILNMEKGLSMKVRGNHFFFVGKYGAKRTADDILVLYSNINRLKKYLRNFDV